MLGRAIQTTALNAQVTQILAGEHVIDSLQLISHIQKLEPSHDPARLAFFSFLQNLTEPNEPLSFELLNRFFYRALLTPTWQENKLQLFTEVNQLVQHYLDHSGQHFSFEYVVRPEQIQVVPIETQSNLRSLVGRLIENNIGKLDQYRIFDERDGRIVAVLLLSDRSIKVMSFHPAAAILTGDLVPLCTDFCVHYQPDLSLSPFEVHQIDLGQFASSRFRYLPAVGSSPAGLRGSFIRGYTFQKFAQLDGGPATNYPMLFYPLKRLEQFFINRKTDPTYIELTTCLEKASDLINEGHPESQRFGMEALERARLAFEQIFPDDKLLRLLINHLEKTLTLQAQADEFSTRPRQQPTPQPIHTHELNAQPSSLNPTNRDGIRRNFLREDLEPGLPIPSNVSAYGWTPQMPGANFVEDDSALAEPFGPDLTSP